MTASQIFTKAHKIAKRNEFNFGTYRQRFSAALKGIYLNIRLRKEQEQREAQAAIEQLEYRRKVAQRLANDTRTAQPTSCYFGAHSWEKTLTA